MRPSVNELRADWLKTRASLVARCAPLGVGYEISSSSDFAASAWQNKIRAWCSELDSMLAEYPADLPSAVHP